MKNNKQGRGRPKNEIQSKSIHCRADGELQKLLIDEQARVEELTGNSQAISAVLMGCAKKYLKGVKV